MNGSDCGVFTCKYAEYVSRGAEITFTQVSNTSVHNSLQNVKVNDKWQLIRLNLILRQRMLNTILLFRFAGKHALLQEANGV